MHRFRSVALRALTAFAVVGASLAITTATSSTPASAAPYVVTLEADDTTPAPNQTVRLRAHANGNVANDGLCLQIYEDGQRISINCFGSNTAGTTDTEFVTYTFGAHRYSAYVGNPSSSEPPSNTQGASQPVTVFWGLGSSTPEPPADAPSHDCDAGTRIIDNNLAGAYVKVYVLSTPTEIAVCYRVDAVTGGFGGKVGLAFGEPVVDLPSIGIPTIDDQSRACAAQFPNLLGPIADGFIGDVYVYAYAYANTSNGVWLCLEVGDDFKRRITIPLDVSLPSVNPNVTPIFEQD